MRGLARRSGLRFIPQLRFSIDSSVSTGHRVEDLLREIRSERGEGAEANPEPGRPEADGEPE